MCTTITAAHVTYCLNILLVYNIKFYTQNGGENYQEKDPEPDRPN